MTAGASRFLQRLSEPGPLVAVELRPPRSGLDAAQSMDVWIDMHHALRRLAGKGTFILLTDDAVGDREEESLAHLTANLGVEPVPRAAGGPSPGTAVAGTIPRAAAGQAEPGAAAGGPAPRAAPDDPFGYVLPFLTCKHPLEYCRLFARRAADLGVAGVTVVGGDHLGGAPRCVPHGQDLRRILRADQPNLALGGWANPHRDPAEQARFIAGEGFAADYVLTQVVSRHSLARVERFHSELDRRGVALPVVHGVFLYRSPNPRTLKQLGRFFPVPTEEVAREFAAGADPTEVCARTIRALRNAGAEKVYVSNLGVGEAPALLEQLL